MKLYLFTLAIALLSACSHAPIHDLPANPEKPWVDYALAAPSNSGLGLKFKKECQ